MSLDQIRTHLLDVMSILPEMVVHLLVVVPLGKKLLTTLCFGPRLSGFGD
jgi:ABC-type dipeptide/oligopeptide/nickel transport system permease subunit